MPDDAAPAQTFGELILAEFVERLGSSDAVPGGGSASAVAGSLAAALVAMVASLSQGRPKYEAYGELHGQAIDVGRRLATRFLELADEDAVAYASYMAATKLPRDSDEERSRRSAALASAARGAAEVPMATVEACLELLATAELLVGRSNSNAASDLNVAALLAEAAARGAAENVLVNLPAAGDESAAGEMTARLMGLLADIQDFASAIKEGVRSGETRDPLPA
jgi:formiminotetrahydrofolate cyclodeaminase